MDMNHLPENDSANYNNMNNIQNSKGKQNNKKEDLFANKFKNKLMTTDINCKIVSIKAIPPELLKSEFIGAKLGQIKNTLENINDDNNNNNNDSNKTSKRKQELSNKN